MTRSVTSSIGRLLTNPLLMALSLLLLPLGAKAQEPALATDAGAPVAPAGNQQPERSKIRDHRFQGFVNYLVGTGGYMVAPYDKDDPEKMCGWNDKDNEGEPVCTGRSGWHMDLLGGFGVKAGLEIFMMFRQGFEDPAPGRPKARAIGAGFKAYKGADGLFKLSIGVVPLFDFSERQADIGNDFIIHIPIGANFDFVRWFGAYFQAAPELSFATEFRFNIDFGLGIQGRFP